MMRSKRCDVVFVVEVQPKPVDECDVKSVDDEKKPNDDCEKPDDGSGDKPDVDVVDKPTIDDVDEPMVTHREIQAHKCILANVSDVFDAMFFGTGSKMKMEKNAEKQQVIRVDDVDADALDFAIDVIYKTESEFEITVENFGKVVYVAEKYNIDVLRKLCVDFGCDAVNILNAVPFLFYANKFGYAQLKEKALFCARADVSTALSNGRSSFLNVDIISLLLTDNIFSLHDCEHIVSAAVSWAMDAVQADGAISISAVHSALAPLEEALKEHTKKFLQFFKAVWYSKFLPSTVLDVVVEPKQFVLKAAVNCDCVMRHTYVIHFSLNKSATLIGAKSPDICLSAFCYVVDGDKKWNNIQKLPKKFYCNEKVRYGIFFGRAKPNHCFFDGRHFCSNASFTSLPFCTCDRGGGVRPLTFPSSDDVLVVTTYETTYKANLTFQYD